MRKGLFALVFMCSTYISAQDVIVLKDGSTIVSKVLEVKQSEIKYKKFSNPNGPVYSANKTDILSINYENGEKDVFGNTSTKIETKEEAQSQRFIKKGADENNARLLSLYNKEYSISNELKRSKKKTDNYILLFGFKPESVLSNEDLEISFKRTVTNLCGYELVIYKINFKNKTNRTLYVDKGNCFKVFNDNTSFCYYNSTEQVTVSKGGGTGGSVGLGGIGIGSLVGGVSVGGGSSQSLAKTYSQQRIIAIPPQSNKNLVDENYIETKGLHFGSGKAVWQTFEYAEWFDYEALYKPELGWFGGNDKAVMGERYFFDPKLPGKLVKTGEAQNYDYSNTPFKQKYIFTYSLEEDFRTYTSLESEIYLRQVIGIDKYRKKNNMFSVPHLYEQNYIQGINDYTLEGYYVIF